MKEITFRVIGFKVVHLSVTTALAQGFGSNIGQIRQAQLTVSRKGLSLCLPPLQGVYGYKPWGDEFERAFDALPMLEPLVFGSQPTTCEGEQAALAIRAMSQWRLARPGPGRPKRGSAWNEDREEFFSLVLRSIEADLGTGGRRASKLAVTRVITELAADNRTLFERAYGHGEDIEAARHDYYQRRKWFEGMPEGAIPLGRILGMRFEYEDGKQI